MYNVVAGDTFDLISRKVYGTEIHAAHVARANPGISDPPQVGARIATPVVPGTPVDTVSQSGSVGRDEVAVSVDGVRFRYWSSIEVVRSVDSIDIASFNAVFDHTEQSQRDAFRPFSYKPVSITIGGRLWFSGVIVGITPVISSNSRTISVMCYASPGVLNDCTSPASNYPLEFNNKNLRDIIETMVKPFGINVIFEGSPGPVFEKIACSPDSKILPFIISLAQQRNKIIGSTPEGALLVWTASAKGSPVARFTQGVAPMISVTPTFKPQGYYSHITGIAPTTVGNPGAQYTEANPRLSGFVRPYVFNAGDTDGSNLKEAVKSKIGRMFADAVSYSMPVPTWRNPAGQLFDRNTTIILEAPDAMIYKPYEFLIKSVTYSLEAKQKTAVLNLVVPEAYAGQVPETLPWD